MWTAAVAPQGKARASKAPAASALSSTQAQREDTDKTATTIPSNRVASGASASANVVSPTAPDGQWQSSLLRKRIAAGAHFHNIAATHAASMLRSEAARTDGQLLDDFSALLRGNAVYIHNFISDKNDMSLYDGLKAELVASTGAKMMGAGGLIDWSKHQVFDNPTDISQTFNDIVDMLAEYFDVDVYATRLNYYRDGTQWKPQHHDSHAYGGRALREDFTVGLTLGAERSLLFVHEASQREFNFPQLNGDCFAFTGEVNQAFTHGVPRVHTPTGDRFSIIAWGRRRTLNERNGGVPSSAASQLKGRDINTMDDAVDVAKQLVAARPAPKPADDVTAGTTAAPPAKRKKNRLQ